MPISVRSSESVSLLASPPGGIFLDLDNSINDVEFMLDESIIDTRTFNVSPIQVGFSEIAFASSIPSEQFFSSHNSTSKITNVLNNATTNIWSDLLQTETQLDINFQITDLHNSNLVGEELLAPLTSDPLLTIALKH